MKSRRLAESLWLVAAGFAVAMTVIFRTDPAQWLVTIAAGVFAVVLGFWLISRPSTRVVSASAVLTVVWTVLYVMLMVQQSDEVAAWTTDIALLAIGLAAGLVTHFGTARTSLRGSIS
jgi:uncharacterized membrane protein HdeD (DUF308 family)